MGLLIYLALGYWAVGKTIYRNKIIIGTHFNIWCSKMALALLFGFFLIPVAIFLELKN